MTAWFKGLLEKLNTFPTIRRQVRAWLETGVMDGKQLLAKRAQRWRFTGSKPQDAS